MDSRSSDHLGRPKPKRLKTLACNVKFFEGNTLLHLLVLENSDPNDSGSEMYMRAVLLSMYDVPASAVNELNDEGYSALHLAVLNNNLAMVNKLLSCLANIDVNARCGLGDENTALHLAVELGHLSIIQELLEKGASIHIWNRGRETALIVAMRLHALDTVKILVSANVNQRTSFTTPLNLAAYFGCLEIAEFLINQGANIDGRHRDGQTPLHDAAFKGNLDIVKLLIGKGADLHATDEEGNTPLHDAVLAEKFECASFLLDQGAHLNATDVDGWTPLHVAAHDDLVDNVIALLDRGADVNARDIDGNTPLDIARERQNQSCIDVLQNVG